ncbi:MAG: hypothetical protein ACYDCL_16355 [Myxococcales bacterium]
MAVWEQNPLYVAQGCGQERRYSCIEWNGLPGTNYRCTPAF